MSEIEQYFDALSQLEDDDADPCPEDFGGVTPPPPTELRAAARRAWDPGPDAPPGVREYYRRKNEEVLHGVTQQYVWPEATVVRGRHVGKNVHPGSSVFPSGVWVAMGLSGALGVHPVDVYHHRDYPWEQPAWALPSWAFTLPEHPVLSPYESRCRCCGDDVAVGQAVYLSKGDVFCPACPGGQWDFRRRVFLGATESYLSGVVDMGTRVTSVHSALVHYTGCKGDLLRPLRARWSGACDCCRTLYGVGDPILWRSNTACMDCANAFGLGGRRFSLDLEKIAPPARPASPGWVAAANKAHGDSSRPVGLWGGPASPGWVAASNKANGRKP